MYDATFTDTNNTNETSETVRTTETDLQQGEIMDYTAQTQMLMELSHRNAPLREEARKAERERDRELFYRINHTSSKANHLTEATACNGFGQGNSENGQQSNEAGQKNSENGQRNDEAEQKSDENKQNAPVSPLPPASLSLPPSSPLSSPFPPYPLSYNKPSAFCPPFASAPIPGCAQACEEGQDGLKENGNGLGQGRQEENENGLGQGRQEENENGLGQGRHKMDWDEAGDGNAFGKEEKKTDEIKEIGQEDWKCALERGKEAIVKTNLIGIRKEELNRAFENALGKTVWGLCKTIFGIGEIVAPADKAELHKTYEALHEQCLGYPTLEEVTRFINDNHLNIDPKRFYEYNCARNWSTKDGRPIRNWRTLAMKW